MCIQNMLKQRRLEVIELLNAVKSFRRRMGIQHQPAHKLYQAIMQSIAKNTELGTALSKLTLRPSPRPLESGCDQRVTLSGNLLEIKVRYLELEDSFEVLQNVELKHISKMILSRHTAVSPATKIRQFLEDCEKLIGECTLGRLPKPAVQASLYYARIAQIFACVGVAKDTDRTKTMSYRSTARRLLAEAKELRKHPFRGRDALLHAVASSEEMLNKDFYEEVLKEELEAIKTGMVSGPGGVATHFGHWYNCVNGHTVSCT